MDFDLINKMKVYELKQYLRLERTITTTLFFFQTFMNITFLFFPLKKFIMAIRTPYYCTVTCYPS